MNKLCANCGKPVYFAERKSSLGKDWHRACLKCVECGKVLSPGQHAEHKGHPYCHNPCYRALFGPSMLGYGSNISSPANFVRRDQATSERAQPSHGNGFKREIITYHNQTVKNTNQQESQAKKLISQPSPSNTLPKAGTASLSLAENHQSSSKLENGISSNSREMREILQKVEEFNKFHEGKVHHQMMAEEKPNGLAFVEGPLRIYWGLSRPIQLVHCDNIPPAPISQWRHSLHVGPDSPGIPNRGLSNTMSLRRTGSPPRKFKDMDDPLLSPTSDDVVRRKKKGVRKFKTVAYRGDQPTKWKRASINGHVFNFDTSVFTPVLGSCTSVTVDSTLNSSEVIETLLDKFKVQNSPEEYVLSVVSENDERLLTSWDKPLLERLKLGPDEAAAKIFIKEREPEQEVVAEDSSISMPIQETPESENLPHEVEQLLVLPEAVLKGILVKFKKDEENEISLVKARYETAKKRMQKRLGELQRQSYQSSSKV